MRGMRTRRGVCAAALIAGVLAACGGETSRPATGTGTPATAPPRDASADLEQRYAQAWQLAEMDGRPADATRLFREIADHPDAPDALRARSLLGLARAARAAGDRDAADVALRTIEESYAALPGVRDAAREERARLTGSVAVWSRVDATCFAGQSVDLDSGSLVTGRALDDGGAAELTLRDGAPLFLVAKSADDGFTQSLGVDDPRPWWRVRTDRGADAWVCVTPVGGSARVEALVRRGGANGPVLPVPRATCVGDAGAIDVVFRAIPSARSYRVERRTAPGAPYVRVGETATPRYHDTDVRDGVRYGYRVVAVAASGDESPPATVQGTTAGRGVFAGSCVLGNEAGRRSVDLLTGDYAADGDITLTGTYGGQSSASFVDGAGRPVPAPHGDARRNGMNADWTPGDGVQIAVGATFEVALQGGGAARVRLDMPDDAWHVTLHYEVDPDAPPFARAPEIAFDERADGTELRVTTAAGQTVREIRAHDPFDAHADRTLHVTDGVVFDPLCTPGTSWDYEAVAVDGDGRRSPRGRASCNRLPDEVRRGTFEICYREGWSIDRDAPAAAGEADIVCVNCAGGISSMTFRAPRGIVTLESVVGRDASAPSATRLAPAVLGLVAADDARMTPWKDDAHTNAREPASNVLVLRTLRGGYARLALVERRKSGNWTRSPAVFEYAYNPRVPRFEEADERAQVVRGVVLAPAAVPASLARDAARRGSHVVGPESADGALRGTAGGSMPADDACQEVLLARARYGDVEKSTYHFGLAARDDPGLALRGDTFDVTYLGDALDVNVGTGVLSLVSDVGAFTWQEVAEQQPQSGFGNMPAVASHGHVYALHAPHSRAFAEVLLRVTALDPGVRCAFEWIAWDANGVVHTSQGLVLDEATRAGLARLVASHAEILPGARAQPKSSRSAASTGAQIRETSVSLNANDAPLADVLREICAQAGVPLRFADGAAEELEGRRTSCSVAGADAGTLLDMLAGAHGVTWAVGEDGAVVVSKK